MKQGPGVHGEGTPLLRLERVWVTYGRAVAVNGVTLSVGAGQAIGLIGPNGAGKSSTLLATMGAVKWSGGDIAVRGRSIRGKPPEAVARLGLALVPEGRHLFHGMSVRENLALGMVARRKDRPGRVSPEWVTELFPVTAEFASRPAGLLSGGQQQQVAIARALLSDPDVLLLDEPSLGLAPTVVDAVFGALEQIRAEGIGILLVEQRAQRTIQFCERTFVLARGEIRLEVTGDGVEQADQIAAAYLGAKQ